MHFHVIGVDHESASLSVLASVSQDGALASHIMTREPGVAGAMLLSTCNRFELITDAADTVTGTHLLELVRAELTELVADPETLSGLRVWSGEDAAHHLFTVGAGLSSAVVGDKQVAGQLRRAYEGASERGQCTARMHRLLHACLRTARTVASQTSLGAVGRSAAGVGLELATREVGDLRGRRVLLAGTGSFARVVVAELVTRRVGEIMCWSASGRADDFARHHNVRPVGADELAESLAAAELVVTCSGNGVVLDAETLLGSRRELSGTLTPRLPVVDLSLGGDVSADAGQLPGVLMIRLDEVIAAADEEHHEVIEEAQRVVDQGTQDYLAKERSRGADPLVAALCEHVNELLDAEIARCHEKESEEVATAVERSLRHATGVLLHTPMVRVAQLAEQGRLDVCTQALDTLFGIEVDKR
ncbi:glutamyl-tRNA reductase [Propionibacterium sp.]|uniref:glutamyl-tRNA reductase n=1 Tax=Propionibacterium sp. TaxID=1977903 RepID=UPI0039E7C03B